MTYNSLYNLLLENNNITKNLQNTKEKEFPNYGVHKEYIKNCRSPLVCAKRRQVYVLFLHCILLVNACWKVVLLYRWEIPKKRYEYFIYTLYGNRIITIRYKIGTKTNDTKSKRHTHLMAAHFFMFSFFPHT